MSNPNSTDSITQPRWQRRPEARPEEILDAAQKVFGESGFARAKLDDVARLAGVSKGTLYLYFDSKETLFREVVRAKIIALLAESEALVKAHSGSCRDLLVQLITGMFDSMRDHEIVKISRVAQAEFASFPELAQFYFHEVIVRARRLVAQVLQQGVEAGEFRSVPHDFGARAFPSLLVHSVQVQCWFRPLDPEALSDDETLEGLIDFCLNGVLVRPDSQS
ncbi:MAG TPA: TetR family transcriptional regulator [Gemmatimonadales bacterium]|jgi:AcrR family transcriptional regulator|nr:TetR family transcriptional regulator [Gemmatimonadales bacterium]